MIHPNSGTLNPQAVVVYFQPKWCVPGNWWVLFATTYDFPKMENSK
jgi:hypothetical protein